MDRKDLIRNVLQATGEFNGRQLWKRFTNFDCFGVRIPDRDELMLASVLGDAGEEYGLSLFRGPKAVAFLAALVGSEGPGDDALETVELLGFTTEAFGDLTADAKRFIREIGLNPPRGEQAPTFLAKPPGRQPRLPDESELTLLLTVLRGTIEADKRQLLQPAELGDEEGVCVLTLTGDPLAPQVSVVRERLRQREAPETIPFPSERLDLKGLPHLEATWLVGTPAMPAGIKGDDRTLQVLLVVDDASDLVLQACPVFAGEFQEAAKAMVETFRGKGPTGQKGLPRKILFSSKKLHDVLKPFLEQAGVTCLYKPAIPKLQEIVAKLFADFGSSLPPFADYVEAPRGHDVRVPAANDVAGWKEVDRRLGSRFADYARFEKRFRSSRAARRYFDADNLDQMLEEHARQSVLPAYVSWSILDYRPTRTSKTYAEKMLAEGLPEAEALLLRAKIDSHPTLYRVAGHDAKTGTVELDDVLLGGTVTVHDRLMSENIENNVFIVARVFPAGCFHFLELVGPPLGAMMGTPAVEFLRDCGMEFTREGLRRDSHMFGWLWSWSDDWEANRQPPRLCNTDGDDFLWHTASFSVADQAAVRLALRERQDVQHYDEEDEFIWVKEKGKGARMLGGPVTLGRMEFIGDELVLTVNSARRFAAARKWLERLPGIVFRDVMTRRLDEPEKDRPLDERISRPKPVEITPEMASAVQQMTNKSYMEWLDTPLPVLGGKTPRDVCRTPEGRQQVAMLIRTIPDPMGDAPVRVPREAMLRELGLAPQSSAPPLNPQAPPPSEPTGPLSPGRKAGRNDPCPCGSGKKYKKCCGK